MQKISVRGQATAKILFVYMNFAFPNRLLFLIPQFSGFYPFNSLLDPADRGVSKWLHGTWSMAEIKL